jgi:hypothetical protein
MTLQQLRMQMSLSRGAYASDMMYCCKLKPSELGKRRSEPPYLIVVDLQQLLLGELQVASTSLVRVIDVEMLPFYPTEELDPLTKDGVLLEIVGSYWVTCTIDGRSESTVKRKRKTLTISLDGKRKRTERKKGAWTNKGYRR